MAIDPGHLRVEHETLTKLQELKSKDSHPVIVDTILQHRSSYDLFNYESHVYFNKNETSLCAIWKESLP